MQARVEFNLKSQLFSLRRLMSSLRRENGPGNVVCRMMTVLRMLGRTKLIRSLCFAFFSLKDVVAQVDGVDVKVPNPVNKPDVILLC